MAIHATHLRARDTVAHGTAAFRFDRPAGFRFKPGQAIDVLLPGASGSGESPRHTFSIVSAPFEDEVVIATRMRDSAYKRALGALPPGAAVQIEGPSGSLTLHQDGSRPAVFVAGGIGITPFMSMLRQAAHDAVAQHLVLLYSNRRPEDAAFLAELQALEQRLPRFRLLATMTGMSQSGPPWPGPVGMIDAAMLKRPDAAPARAIYYVAGPPAMVGAMVALLNDAGVGDDDIRSEDFYGY